MLAVYLLITLRYISYADKTTSKTMIHLNQKTLYSKHFYLMISIDCYQVC